MDLYILAFVWLFFSFIVASYAKNKIMGYWGGFFLSLFLSPVIGLIVTLKSKDCKSFFCLRFGKRMKEVREEEYNGNKIGALEKLMNVAHMLQRIMIRSRHPEHYSLYKERITDKILELGGEVPDPWKDSSL